MSDVLVGAGSADVGGWLVGGGVVKVGAELLGGLAVVLSPVLEDPPPGEDPPEQRPLVEGFGKTKGSGELASWQVLPSQSAPELTGNVEGGFWMMV